MIPRQDLAGELTVEGRIATASNATFAGRIGDVKVVYKPVAGERPLWDFPDGTLARRELAAYLVSEAFGWSVVPRTWLRDGPMGVGMVQLWCDADPAGSALAVVPADAVPAGGWRRVVEGFDEEGRRVCLVHEDSLALRRIAVFDVVTNNADRKGGHVFEVPGGHRYGIDHGLTFHTEDKLRTVLWGWAGQDLCEDELAGVERVRAALAGELGEELTELLSPQELAALAARCTRLLRTGVFPAPRPGTHTIPWPIF